MSPNSVSKDLSTHLLARQKPDLHISGMAGFIFAICLLADIIGRPVHAFRLDSAAAIGATLLTGLIDSKKYFANTRPAVFTPGQRSKCYNEIYAKYAAQFPAGATSGSADDV